MKTGRVLSRPAAFDSLGQSSRMSLPVRRRVPSTRASLPSMRWASCSLGISSENTATPLPDFTTALMATLSANEVLPMPGRPAMMIRSPGCMPAVMASTRVKPVGRPVMASPR
jgi:hypothetical protein